jgi:hypothetical protein
VVFEPGIRLSISGVKSPVALTLSPEQPALLELELELLRPDEDGTEDEEEIGVLNELDDEASLLLSSEEQEKNTMAIEITHARTNFVLFIIRLLLNNFNIVN